jgi:hypothetical protein
VSKVLNLLFQLREYLIFLATLMVASQRVSGTLTSNAADTIGKCACTCAAGTPTIEECFSDHVSHPLLDAAVQLQFDWALM